MRLSTSRPSPRRREVGFLSSNWIAWRRIGADGPINKRLIGLACSACRFSSFPLALSSRAGAWLQELRPRSAAQPRGPRLREPGGSERVPPLPPLVFVGAAAAAVAVTAAACSPCRTLGPRPRGAGMHCSCCGSSSWRLNGWRFPAASWTISAGTGAPRAAPAPCRPLLFL